MQGLDAYEKEHPRRVQVVHSTTAAPIEGLRCKVLVTKKLNRCHGVWHYSYPSFTAEFLRSHYLSRKECDIAVKTGKFQFEGRQIEATPGGESFTSYISKGATSNDGHCVPHPLPFTAGNETFKYHVERTSLHIELKKIEGVRDLAHDIVVFDDLRATLSKGYIHAPTHALYWDTKTEVSCDNTLLQSYDGEAKIRTLTNLNGQYDGAIVMVDTDKGGGRFAGFKLAEKVSMCNRTTFATNIPHTYLYIVPYNADVLPLGKFGNSRYTKVETIQLLTGNTAMQFRTSFDMYGGFKSYSEDLCRVERATIQNKLDHISSGGRYGFTKEYGPGYELTLAASVAYVAKCEEREATLATFRNCTRELPVVLGPNDTSSGGQVLFADPLTYNLVPAPTIVTCDSVMPQKWVINGGWYCSYGKGVMLCPAPKKLDPKTAIRGIPNFGRRIPTGIFTRSQIEQHAIALILDGSKDAVLTEMIATAVRASVTHPDGSVTYGVALPDYQIEKMTDLFLWKYFSWTWLLGESCNVVIYTVLGLRLLKWAVDTVILFIRGWEKHRKLGKWVLGLGLNSFTDILFGENNRTKSQKNDDKAIPTVMARTNLEPQENFYHVVGEHYSNVAPSSASSLRFGMIERGPELQ